MPSERSRIDLFLFSRWHERLVRLALGGIFVWSGGIKLLNPKAFAVTVSKYGLVPDELLLFVAFGLPVVEVVAGLGVVFRVRGSLAVILGLLAMFLVVLWYGILHNLEIDCGCFSLDEQAEHGSLWAAFYRDWVMVGAVLYLWFCHWRRRLIAATDNTISISIAIV